MNKLKVLPFIFLSAAMCACNWSPSTNNEGLVDSLTTGNSFTAKADSARLQKFWVSADTFKIDNATNKDTFTLPPANRGINTKNIQPNEVLNFAETLSGIPYVYASTNPKIGFDCSGFITYVFNHFGIAVPRSSIEFTNVGKEIPVALAKRGDIILFTGTNPQEKFVGHMGLVVSNTDTLKFIHSTSGKAMGVTITPLNKYYQTRFVKTIRIFF